MVSSIKYNYCNYYIPQPKTRAVVHIIRLFTECTLSCHLLLEQRTHTTLLLRPLQMQSIHRCKE